LLFEIGKNYKIEYEKEKDWLITYNGEVVYCTESHVQLLTIRGEKVTIRIADIKRADERTEGVVDGKNK
jgi:hypothetical protein